MKIDIDRDNQLRLREVFSGILLETQEGNQIGVCMRDDTLEINVCPSGNHTNNWWRVNMQTGCIESMQAKQSGGGIMNCDACGADDGHLDLVIDGIRPEYNKEAAQAGEES